MLQQVRNQQISMEEVQPKNKELAGKFDTTLAAIVTEDQKAARKAMSGA